jgi:uncharacterized protein YciI
VGNQLGGSTLEVKDGTPSLGLHVIPEVAAGTRVNRSCDGRLDGPLAKPQCDECERKVRVRTASDQKGVLHIVSLATLEIAAPTARSNSMSRYIVLAFIIATLLCFTGCASTRGTEARYVFAYLKTGPNSSSHSPEQKKEIFAGHMANMKRLADERKLIIAGPFAKPADPTWRGLFILDTSSVEEARALVATDPGVISGEFVTECIPLRATPRLREFPDIYQAEDAKRSATPREASSPPPVRAYVMVTASDATQAERAIKANELAERVIWWGRFGGDASRDGVYVIDAKEVGESHAKLGEGPWVVDGWWSDTLLELIPRAPIP